VVEKSEFSVRDVANHLGLSKQMEFSLDCITKRPGETKIQYIYRVMMDMRAMKVKRKDMLHNLSTNPTIENRVFYRNALELFSQVKTA
jgi:hypothetical protein